jgi:undecaprenyl-phosphate galactose phosphotransferase
MSVNTRTIENKQNLTTATTKTASFLALRTFCYRFTKRAFDIVFGLVGCIGVILLIPFVKILYVCTGDFHSIFLKNHMRIGKGGKPFRFYKFRTMVPDAERILHEELFKDPAIMAEYQQNKKLKNDPRITKMGKFLRRTSLDEFPQFINVLKGDMSIIGNRPYMVSEKEDMGEYFDDIVSTKCGIVSWWAVSGRSGLNFQERLVLEQWYSQNFCLKNDLKIFVKAFKAVLCRKGAN